MKQLKQTNQINRKVVILHNPLIQGKVAYAFAILAIVDFTSIEVL